MCRLITNELLMKTSHILLIVIALVTLTGMVATDVLLKQQYDRIDWRNPYQNFEKRDLPTARHWVIEGVPTAEIVVLETVDIPQALVAPDYAKFYRTQQRGDTVTVKFTPDFDGRKGEPRSDADHELNVQVVLRLPKFQTIQVKDGRVTLSELKKDSLRVTLQNSRLRTVGVGISGSFSVTAGSNSYAALGPKDNYKSVQAMVQDSSGIWLDDTPVETFSVQPSPKAEVKLNGRALKWVK